MSQTSQVLLDDQATEELTSHEKERFKFFSDQGEARYKVEAYFASSYSVMKPFPGVVTFWENGTAHRVGESDQKVYLCPGKSLRRNDCERIIPEMSNGNGWLICPHCSTLWKADEVHGEINAVLTIQNWAKNLLMQLGRCQMNADLVVHRYPVNLQISQEMVDDRWGEKFEKDKTKLVRYMYPRANMIKDTAAGADLLRRIEAFLKA